MEPQSCLRINPLRLAPHYYARRRFNGAAELPADQTTPFTHEMDRVI